MYAKKKSKPKQKNTNAQMYARKTSRPPVDLSDCSKIGKRKIKPKVVKFPIKDPVETKREPVEKVPYDAHGGTPTSKTKTYTRTNKGKEKPQPPPSEKITTDNIPDLDIDLPPHKSDSLSSLKRPFLSPLYFHFDQDELTEEDRKTLRTAISFMKHGFLVLLEGHTDNWGTHEYNEKLSLERATRIREIMIKQMDAPADKVVVKAYGERNPAIHNENAVTRQLNRRVEVKLLYPEELKDLK